MPRTAAFTVLFLAAVFCSLPAQGTRIVRPKEIDSLLFNPGVGFNNSQHLNMRQTVDGRYQLSDPQLPIERYPRPSHAYLRFDWRYFEPERGKFNWYIIDDALKLAVERGERLALRVVPYGSSPREDIPDWLRAELGPYDSLSPPHHPYWRVKHSEPQYIKAMTKMVAALGARYDGNPDIEFVDVSIIGFWGEGEATRLVPQEAREKLVDAYLNAFKKTTLVIQLTDPFTNTYAVRRADVGWRIDCLGDLGFWAAEQNGWFHMADIYPQSVAGYGASESWKTAPVVLEICGTFGSWKSQQHYDSLQVAYNLAQSLKWHVSMFNAKSGAVPPEWRGMVDEWLKRMGYRLVLRRFEYPQTVRPQGKLAFTSWWENKGVAPCYRNYPVALRLVGKTRTEVLLTDSDIRKWLPGDALLDSAVFVPLDLPEGEYELQLGILDPLTRRPIIKLGNAGRNAEGWYGLGSITVKM